MKLYIKETLFSVPEHFLIKDEAGNDIYEVKGKMGVHVGVQLWIYDMTGREVGRISQKALSLKPTFRVYRGDVQTATIVKKFTMLKPSYTVEELNWTIKGDFLAHQYTVSDSTGVVMSISKEWLAWGDSFVLDMADMSKDIEALAVVLAIDHIVDSEGNGFSVDGKRLS